MVHGVIKTLTTAGFLSCPLLTANAMLLGYVGARAQRCPRDEDEWYDLTLNRLRRSMKVLSLVALVWCLTQVFDDCSRVVPYPEERSRALWRGHVFEPLPLAAKHS